MASIDDFKSVIDICEFAGWGVTGDFENHNDPYFEISQPSPAGEDFSFSVYADNPKEFIAKVNAYYMEFSPSEHAEMWVEARLSSERNGNGTKGIPDVETLVEDAKEIQNLLKDLAHDLNEYERTLGGDAR